MLKFYQIDTPKHGKSTEKEINKFKTRAINCQSSSKHKHRNCSIYLFPTPERLILLQLFNLAILFSMRWSSATIQRHLRRNNASVNRLAGKGRTNRTMAVHEDLAVKRAVKRPKSFVYKISAKFTISLPTSNCFREVYTTRRYFRQGVRSARVHFDVRGRKNRGKRGTVPGYLFRKQWRSAFNRNRTPLFTIVPLAKVSSDKKSKASELRPDDRISRHRRFFYELTPSRDPEHHVW